MSHPTIDDVRDLAQAGHREKKNDTPEETLNRLWLKHFDEPEFKYGVEFIQAVPRCLTDENTSVALQEWSTEKLSKLIINDRDRPILGRETDPVIIVKFRNIDCLIDGGRRITKWRKEKDPSPHAAYVLSLSDQADSEAKTSD